MRRARSKQAKIRRDPELKESIHDHLDQRATPLHRPGTLIGQRPVDVDDRQVPGHWESDLVVGRGNRSAIGTLVDRTTRYVKLLLLPDGRTAEHVRDTLLHAFADLPAR